MKQNPQLLDNLNMALIDQIGRDVEDIVRRKANVDVLMKMQAVGSVGRNLRREDAEMAHDYDRHVRLIDGKNAKDLEFNDEDEDMMVAGDVNVKITPEQPDPVPAPIPAPVQQAGNSLMQNILSAALGAGLLGGGIGVGNLLTPGSEPEKPAVVVPAMKDTDTIGVLEPDK